MPTYEVTIEYSASITHLVEADSEEEAEKKAKAIEEPKDVFAEQVLETIEFVDCFAVERQPGAEVGT